MNVKTPLRRRFPTQLIHPIPSPHSTNLYRLPTLSNINPSMLCARFVICVCLQVSCIGTGDTVIVQYLNMSGYFSVALFIPFTCQSLCSCQSAICILYLFFILSVCFSLKTQLIFTINFLEPDVSKYNCTLTQIIYLFFKQNKPINMLIQTHS